jgi:hypothetical protein
MVAPAVPCELGLGGQLRRETTATAITVAEAAQEMDLSLAECEAWLAGEDIPGQRRLYQRYPFEVATRDPSYYDALIPGGKIETRDPSYYDCLIPGFHPENDPAPENSPSLPDAA